jgi:hypothetical protein
MNENLELTEERVDRLFEMLNSPDEGSMFLAFNVLKQIDLTKNIGYFLTLYKFSNPDYMVWSQSGLLDLIDYDKLKGIASKKLLTASGLSKGVKNWSKEIRVIVEANSSEEVIKYYKQKADDYFAELRKYIIPHDDEK